MCSWKKDRVLGTGAFGTVYLAVPGHPSSSCVAVKTADFKFSDSLREEEEFLYSLRGHPNIVHCYGTDTSLENGRLLYNLLLEYAPGGTLQTLIESRQGKMSEAEVAFYAYQLLKGLSDLHALGIVHCDLKPHNILVFPMQDGGNRLKIADFGLAIRDVNTLKVSLSKNYDFRGTLLYTSPESLLHGVHKVAKDIWGLGCIIVEMITGKPVWEYRNKEDLKMKIKQQEPKIPDNISMLCKDFLKRCLNRNSFERWSAEGLMTHPFILKNFDSVRYWTKKDCNYELPENPFGYDDQWISYKDLFSTFDEYSYYDYMEDN